MLLQVKAGPPDIDERHNVARLAVLVVGLALVGLFLRHVYPPLFDWPNHMARHHLEALLLAGRPLPPGYAIQYGLMPNLGADLVMPALIVLFGPTAASVLFLAGAVLLVWAAATALYGQYAGRAAALTGALLVAPWLVSVTLFLGFLNSFSGCGVGILVAVHFMRLAREGFNPVSLVVHAALAVGTYLWHLSAFGIYGVFVASFMLDQWLNSAPGRRRETLLRLLPLAAATVPALAVMAWVARSPQTNALAGTLHWRPLSAKLLNFAEQFMAYRTSVDAVLLLVWLIAIGLLFARPAWRRPRLDYMGIAGLAFLTLAFALPSDMGLTYFVDKRPILPLLIVGCGLLASLPPARTYRIGLLLLAALAVGRIAYVDVSWTQRSAGVRALLAAFEGRPKAPRILVANTHYGFRRGFETHIAGWLVIRAGAYVSNLWAVPGQQPLRHTAASHGLVPSHFLTDPKVLCTHAAAIADHFDFVWVNDQAAMVHVPDGWLRTVQTGESALYEVGRDPGACTRP